MKFKGAFQKFVANKSILFDKNTKLCIEVLDGAMNEQSTVRYLCTNAP